MLKVINTEYIPALYMPRYDTFIRLFLILKVFHSFRSRSRDAPYFKYSRVFQFI